MASGEQQTLRQLLPKTPQLKFVQAKKIYINEKRRLRKKKKENKDVKEMDDKEKFVVGYAENNGYILKIF